METKRLLNKRQESPAVTDAILSPFRLFARVLIIVFVAETVIMLFFQMLPETMNHWVEALLDGSMLTLLSAPFLWWAIARPLQVAAESEHVKSTIIVNTAADGIITINEQGLIQSFNPAAEAIFGYEAMEVVGQDVKMLLPKSHKDNDDNHINKYIDTGQVKLIDSTPFEIATLHKNGHVFPADLTLSEMYMNKARNFIGIVRDITERKQAEEELRRAKEFAETVLNSMYDAISIIDVRTYEIVGANSVFLNDLNLSAAELMGQTCFAATHNRSTPCAPPNDTCPLHDTCITKKPATAEHIHFLANGQKQYVEIMTSPIKDESGQVIQVVHTARDITKRKMANQALRAYAARLEQSNRELEDLTYIASHDLQEPLRKLQTFGSRLQTQYGQGLGMKGGEYVTRMQNMAEQMQALLDDLILYLSVSTKARPFTHVDLNEVMRWIRADLEPQLEQVGGQIRVNELPTIEADSLQIQQLLAQLVSNALKFCRSETPPLITIEGQIINNQANNTMNKMVPEELARITVTDNGIGFEKKYAERIFNVFERLQSRSKFKGNGMGLAICKKIAERHGGAITAHSIPGQGTTFIVILPTIQTNEEDSI